MILGDPLLQRNPDGTQGSVLRNQFGVQDQVTLDKLEAAVTSMSIPALRARLAAEPAGPSTAPVLDRLQDIHKEMFGAMYDWAGQTREVNIAKRDPVTKEVTKFEYIANLGLDPGRVTAADRAGAKQEFAELGARIDDWLAKQPKPANPEQLAERLTGMFQQLNNLHPFREGNGRSIRELLRDEAHRHGSSLVLDNISRADWISASVSAQKGDSKAMQGVLQDSLAPRTQTAVATRAASSPGVDLRAGLTRAANYLRDNHGLDLALPDVAKIATTAAKLPPGQQIDLEIGSTRHKIAADGVKEAVIQGAVKQAARPGQTHPGQIQPKQPPSQAAGRER